MSSPLRDVRVTARVGWVQGIAVAICFVTGLISAVAWALGCALLVHLAAAMLWAGWLVFSGGAATDPVRVSIWLVGGLGLHDALVIGVLTLASIPLLLGRGRRPDNPSADPVDYSHNLLVLMGVVVSVCAVWALLARQRQRQA